MSTRQPFTRRRRRFGRALSRRGISMLELVIAGSMLAGVMTSLSVVMRTARQSWEISESDSGSLHQLQAVVRHVVRSTREAQSVVAVGSGGASMTLKMRDGSTMQWGWKNAQEGMPNVVTMNSSQLASPVVLARNIRSLQFEGFEADGVTQVGDAADMRLISVTATIQLADAATSIRTAHSKVWIRSW